MDRFDARDLADFHNHLVPGVDDGARSMAESIRHLRALARDGITRLAVSPHLDARLVHDTGALYARLERLEEGFEELRATAAEEGGTPTLSFSQEILVPDPDTARLVFLEPRVGIRGTDYALIEFGFDLGDDPVGVVKAVRAAGRRPIVAHPERYRRGQTPVPIEEIESWKEAGALLQINGGSVLGNYGPAIASLAWQLLERGLADLCGTDHHADSRPVSPAQVGQKLVSRGFALQARLLLSENPQRVLKNQETLPVPPPASRAAA